MITIPMYLGIVMLASLLTFALLIWLQNRSSLSPPPTGSDPSSEDKG